MGDYVRVLPRDLFNEADLLKCMGRLWILLDETHDHHGAIVEEDVASFDVTQDEADGSISLSNVTFTVRGIVHTLVRPLNSRSPWPLRVEASDRDPDFDPIRVFDEDGSFSQDMLALIHA